MNFSYTFDHFGEIQTKELIPNGNEIYVNESNKNLYVQLICYAKMADAVKGQLESLLEGLHEVVDHRMIRIFDAK
jgi:hypothetical protein